MQGSAEGVTNVTLKANDRAPNGGLEAQEDSKNFDSKIPK